eukprot:GHVU01179965.1.p1 GENE.GHVU01179965.1~~GHVU01179965.1.p1  ORF type:complete len:248 (+),score=27.13 GHVU01179965.1:29-745(+)
MGDEENHEDWTCEFVSVPFALENHKLVIETFKDMIQEMFQIQKLSKALHFNESCGAHIHMSFWKKSKRSTYIYSNSEYDDSIKLRVKGTPFDLLDRMSYEYLATVSNKIKKEMQKKFPNIYPNWNRQYNRSYARKMKINSPYPSSERDCEWNIINQRRIEWRANNLMGITNWKDFTTVLSFLFKRLDKHLLRKSNKRYHWNYVREKECITNFNPILSKKYQFVMPSINVQKKKFMEGI